MKKRLVAAISGGVDSSVASAIYKEQGYEVIGATLRLKSCDTKTEKRKSCCSIDDDLQARSACELIGIPHYFIDGKEDFDAKVLQYAWGNYNNALTPNPCIMCNVHLKWGKLLNYALQIGAEGIITGHYANIINQDGISILERGDDFKKDQSYFLAFLTQEQLKKTHFPLGKMTKVEVREYAAKLNLPNKEKEESQDACFGFAGEAFSETLRKYYNTKPKIGYFVNQNEKILGKHKGIHLYTIGQRKGMGLALGVPAYVSKIDINENLVYITTEQDDLCSKKLYANNINWQNPLFLNKKEFECEVQIRYCHKPVSAYVTVNKDSIEIEFEKSQRAVTPGQAVVMYDKNNVIGGGWITS